MDIASSSTEPTKATVNNNKKRGGGRLKKQALDILEDYFQKVSQTPSSVEKEALLDKIKVVPGCPEDYDITRWFANRRSRFRMKERKDNNIDPRFPSLTPATIQHLTVLASSQLNPSPELLKTWAALLASTGAKEQDVANWVHYRNQEQQIQHFPTPSDTTMTPEPSSATSQSPMQSTFPRIYKQETITSPVMPTLELHPHEHPRIAPSEPSSTSAEPASNNDDLHLSQHPRARALQAIIHGVCDDLAGSQTMPNVAPKTAAEFEAMFFPFEQQISLLLRALETT